MSKCASTKIAAERGAVRLLLASKVGLARNITSRVAERVEIAGPWGAASLVVGEKGVDPASQAARARKRSRAHIVGCAAVVCLTHANEADDGAARETNGAGSIARLTAALT